VIEPPDESEHDRQEGDNAYNCKEIVHVVIMNVGREQAMNGYGIPINNS